MQRLRAHFARRSGRRRLGAAFLTVFGGLWLIVEPAGLFFPHAFKWGWRGYGDLVLASAVAAVVRARPRDIVMRSIPPTDVRVAIRVGDALEQAGNVIVGTNDTFDTQFESEVISRASVQGQLLERVFGGDRGELDRQIDACIGGVHGVQDAHKQFGKSVRYRIGTVAVVRCAAGRYFLPAFARVSSTLPAHVQATIEDLQVALAATWKAINAARQREPVHAPIVGSHLARLGVSRTLLAQMLILSFIVATRSGGPSSLTVWFAPQDRDVIDMVVLDEWLRGLCAA